MARIAVLIPCFNAAQTIGETLESLRRCEGLSEMVERVCVVDDASVDGSSSIVRDSWHCTTPLMTIENLTNRGERASVNEAISKLASHDWICILHADDLVKPNWLRLLKERIDACDAGVASICSSYDVWYPALDRTDPGEEAPGKEVVQVPGTTQSIRDTLVRGCWWHISGCAIRAQAFREIGPFSEDMPQLGDWEWLLRCHERGYSVEYIPRSLMLYRMHASSVSSASFRSGRDIRERLRIFARFGHYLTLQERRKLLTAVQRSVLRRLAKSIVYLRAKTAGGYLRMLLDIRQLLHAHTGP